MELLDSLPPEMVRQRIIERGKVDPALDTIQEIARGTNPDTRAQARALIAQRQLGLLLADEEDAV